ncbi:phosphoenolpyruvate--protein phosphotransferase [Calothrix rhizosoleniae]|uniref:phosphoenolpyruvate--protein phosphotransferase n=1 Tax=Calothrix rhizosoleniae TaxID=888997 RepID=UPI000B49F8C5|nr:phosphoenolpyruvate--protein phosphotransferase [Calothrix rhizosoleniae]
MVGIIIVSHSKQLAEGVRELSLQMVQGEVAVAIAAGIDDPENPLGTDTMQVYQAIASVYSDDGVLVLMDLGSAVMSAEMALEFFPDEQRQNMHLCAAPLVEGTIAAVVAAASGQDIHQVMAEAQAALTAKATQLGSTPSSLESVPHEPLHTIKYENASDRIPTPDSPLPIFKLENKSEIKQAKEIHVFVRNYLGLHARPAAKFVTTSGKFQSQIWVRNLTKNSDFVRGDSINQVTTLGVHQGDKLAIAADGIDADAALLALRTLVESNFGETARSWGASVVDGFLPGTTAVGAASLEEIPQSGGDDFTPVSSPVPSSLLGSVSPSLQGIPASRGVAIAPMSNFLKVPLAVDCSTSVDIPQSLADNPEIEWQKLHKALGLAQQEIQTLLSHADTQIGDAEAGIFDAHLLLLQDPMVMETAHRYIFTGHLQAGNAWQTVIDEVAANYHQLEDSYLQERVADVVDVGQRVLRLLLGKPIAKLDISQPAIVVANDLTPSDTASLDPNLVLGICITAGSATSHTAIIARSLGIPAVVGLPPSILHLADGTAIAMDGGTGMVWVEPDEETINCLQNRQKNQQLAQQQALTIAHQPATTIDGTRISVFANIVSINDVQSALDFGAEGVGLFRTEFLYMDRTTPPSETEQLAVYQAIAQTLGNRPLIIRTLDVGGDKPLPYVDLPPETNPFLGMRGIRFCLQHLQIWKTQLKAIFRASAGQQIKVMFPMIATMAEIQAAKAILAEVQAELYQAHIPFDTGMEVGIMVEVPSATAIADKLATEVDFFSIGTNDLSQYVMASDRTNPLVANLADPFHPSVLRTIQQTIQAAHQAGIWVGLCGELASEPLAAPILLGLGVDEVSLNAPGIPRLKQAIAQLALPQTQAIAQAALQADSAVEVRELVTAALL